MNCKILSNQEKVKLFGGSKKPFVIFQPDFINLFWVKMSLYNLFVDFMEDISQFNPTLVSATTEPHRIVERIRDDWVRFSINARRVVVDASNRRKLFLNKFAVLKVRQNVSQLIKSSQPLVYQLLVISVSVLNLFELMIINRVELCGYKGSQSSAQKTVKSNSDSNIHFHTQTVA